MASARFVAAMTTTLPRSTSPSIRLRRVDTTLVWIWSETLPPLAGAMPSSSSKKMMEGEAFCASWNSSLSFLSASPWNFPSRSAPLREKKDTLPTRECLLHSPARALTTIVFPVPGSP